MQPMLQRSWFKSNTPHHITPCVRPAAIKAQKKKWLATQALQAIGPRLPGSSRKRRHVECHDGRAVARGSQCGLTRCSRLQDQSFFDFTADTKWPCRFAVYGYQRGTTAGGAGHYAKERKPAGHADLRRGGWGCCAQHARDSQRIDGSGAHRCSGHRLGHTASRGQPQAPIRQACSRQRPHHCGHGAQAQLVL